MTPNEIIALALKGLAIYGVGAYITALVLGMLLRGDFDQGFRAMFITLWPIFIPLTLVFSMYVWIASRCITISKRNPRIGSFFSIATLPLRPTALGERIAAWYNSLKGESSRR